MLGLFNMAHYPDQANAPATVLGNFANIELAGDDDYVDVSCVKDQIDLDTGSISIWVYFAANETPTERVVSFWSDDDNMIEILWIGGSNYFRGKYRGGGSSKLVNTPVDTGYDTSGNWIHVGMTWDTSASPSILQMYINGSPANNVTDLPTHTDVVPTAVYLGAKADTDAGASSFFDGKMDEIAFFKATLTDADMVDLYSCSGTYCPVGGSTGIMTNYYRIEEKLTGVVGSTDGLIDTAFYSLGISASCEGVLTNGAIRTTTNVLQP